MLVPVEADTLIGTGPAPRLTLYLLDGVDGGVTSGRLIRGDAAEFFVDKPIDMVLATGGTASMYTDWVCAAPRSDRTAGRRSSPRNCHR
ncbi:hypothetical protein [Nocardia brevicatena]|uniref:hypothetical protein n=1 Tax=Nocardia brevicatena TaxID=37327 RepID=UPI00146165C7|nr:hypothetical protein [Nocardia brevicatena]